MRQGLYDKYIIQKADGTELDPGAQYFVLRLDTDPAAQVAILAYAEAIKGADPKLAKQLRELVSAHDLAPSVEGCLRSGQGDGKHQWIRFPSHWICSWCGKQYE